MKVSYIFSRNNKIGSRLIVWFSELMLKKLEKTPSHVALLIELDDVKLVVESVMSCGVRLLPYSAWLNINEECYKIPAEAFPYDIYKVVGESWGKKYDWLGVVYFVVAFLRKKLFNKPFPDKNRWSSDNRHFCTEIVAKLAGYANHEMATPAKMCYDMLKAHSTKKSSSASNI